MKKHFERNNLNVVEHYSNDQLNMYFETENKGIDDTFETKGMIIQGVNFSIGCLRRIRNMK